MIIVIASTNSNLLLLGEIIVQLQHLCSVLIVRETDVCWA